MQSPLVSIIVPIYKVESYLRRCLDSIVNQTYTNLEIILVDDGSPDGCPQICDEYAAKDERIVVIHKENGGLSDARNAGLDICKGEYVSFVDSDDWVDEKYIEVLLDLAVKENADIAIGGYKTISNDDEKKLISNCSENKVEILTNLQAVAKLFSNKGIVFVIACGKLYQKKLFEVNRFPKGKLNEDEYVSYKVLYASQKCAFLDVPLYNYFQRVGSIMANIENSSLRVLDAHTERYLFFKIKGEKELTNLCVQNLCWDHLFAYGMLSSGKKVRGFQSKNDALVKYRDYVQEYISYKNSYLGKILHMLFSKFPCIYLLYRKLSPYKIRKV